MPILRASFSGLALLTAAFWGPPVEPPVTVVDGLGDDGPEGPAGEGELWLSPLGVKMVSLSSETWRELQPRDPEPAMLPPTWPESRRVRVRAADGGLELTARWTLRSMSETGDSFDAELIRLGDEMRLLALRVDGREVAPAMVRVEDGRQAVMLGIEVEDRAEVELRVRLAPDVSAVRGPVRLDLLEAVRGSAAVERRADGPLEDWGWLDEAGDAWTEVDGEVWDPDALALAPGALADGGPTAAGRLALATVGLGVTVGEAETRMRARVRWQLRRGELDTVRLEVPAAGRDLQVEGPNVRTWSRAGDELVVELLQPARELVLLELSWSVPTPSGTQGHVALPTVTVRDAYRVEGAVQLARDGEVQVLPRLDAWTPRASAQLPAWSEGLVAGTPTAAFVGGPGTGGTLDLLRFVPVQGPPVLVDVADYQLALSREGRLIGQVRYEVRNDRSPFLRIDPPAGVGIIGVRVAGEVVAPARDGDSWLVPLRRSVETLDGLISFPVEVALLGEPARLDPFERRRERHELELPVLDAPVAAQRVTMHLPPRYTSRLEAGEQGVVVGFSEGDGIAYGFAAGDGRGEVADALFQSAVKSWLDNDFRGAQDKLDQLGQLGGDNENVARLQSNLDLVLDAKDRRSHAGTGEDASAEPGSSAASAGISLAGTTSAESAYTLDGANVDEPAAGGEASRKRADKAGAAGDAKQAMVARRVRQQARARAGEQRLAQERSVTRARQLRNEGNYREAEQAYAQAIELGDALAALEDEESMEQVADNRMLAEELAQTRADQVQQEVIENTGKRAVPRSESSKSSKFVESKKKQAPRKSKASKTSNLPKADDGIRTYEFEDDDVDGELPMPEGAEIAARARSRHGDLAGEGMGLDARDLPVDASVEPVATTTTTTATAEEAGESAPSAKPDEVLVLGGTADDAAEAEPEPAPPMPMADEAPEMERNVARISSVRRGRSRRRPGRRKKEARTRAPAAPPDASRVPSASPGASVSTPGPVDPNAALDGPQVTASGLALVIPAIGETVRYQELLIPPGRRPSLTIDARKKPRRRR